MKPQIYDEPSGGEKKPSPDGNTKRRPAAGDFAAAAVCLLLLCGAGLFGVDCAIFLSAAAAALLLVISFKFGMYFLPLPPAIAFVVCFTATENYLCALPMLFALMLAFAMHLSLRTKDQSKTRSVLFATLACILFLAFLFFGDAIMQDLSPNGLLLQIDGLFDQSVEAFLSFYDSLHNAGSDLSPDRVLILLQDAMASVGTPSYLLTYVWSMLANGLYALTAAGAEFTHDQLAAMLRDVLFQAKAILPALAVIFSLLVSYLSVSLLKPLSKLLRVPEMIRKEPFEITLSVFTVIAYFISFLGMFYAFSPVSYGFRNFSYILAPGLMLCGVKQAAGFFAQKGFSKPAIVLIDAAILFIALLTGTLGSTVLIILGMFYATKSKKTAK